MKISRLCCAALVVAAILMLPRAPAQAAAGDPGTGLLATPHDFTTPAVGTNTTPVGLCTFCHTPHKAISTKLLWNHTLSSNSFKWDVPSTTAGTTYPTIAGQTYQGPTAKCLSCHDGTVAIGDVAWFEEGSAVLNNATLSGEFQIATATGSMAGNHPVAMPYPYQQQQNTYNGVTTGTAYYPDQWQSTPVSPARLYNDDGSGDITAGAVAGKSGIECSSCHDPHNKLAVADLFLLGQMTGNDTSYICLKCHIK